MKYIYPIALSLLFFFLSLFPAKSQTCPNPGDLIITEIMQNPSAVSDSNGEYFEIYNTTSADFDIDGFTIKDDGSNSHVIASSIIVSANGYAVLGINSDMNTNGGVAVDYEYSSFSLANGDDEVILLCSGTEIDRVNYDDGTTFPDPSGASMNLDPASFDASSNDDGANWCEATSEITAGGDLGTPGADNDACSVTPTCSITALFTSNEACNGSDFEFDVNFTPTNGSGVYEVIEVGGSTLATGTVSPIQINIANSSMTGTIDIQVRDANDTACSSTIVQVTVQDCTLPPCAISGLSISNESCNGIDFEFEVNFTPANGSGSYEVIETGGSTLATGTVSPIQVTIANSSMTGTIDIQVRDAINTACSSTVEVVNLQNCISCPSPGDLIITEIMQNPNAVGDNDGEYFEIYNTTGADIDIAGFTMKDDGANAHGITSSLIVPANGFAVLGINSDMNTNGGVPVDYEYNSFSLTNSADEVILVCATTEIDRVNYDDGTTFPDPNGASMNLDPASFDASSNDEGANWCEATSEIISGGDLGTPGADNDACSVTPTCSITALFTSNEACNGSDFEFDVNFTPTNGSGVYEVIEVGGSTLATSTVSPIQINIANSSMTGTIDIQVRDANDTACSSTIVQVTVQDCTLPPCAISGLSISNESCNGIDFEFEVNFTPANGSGSYEVIETGGSTLATGTVSPIQVTIANSSMTGTIDIQVRDAINTACSSTVEVVNLQNCISCPSPGDLIITEIMQNPNAVGDNDGEYFEIYNTTGADIDMAGFTIKDDGTNAHGISSSLIVPANGFAVLGINSDMNTNGGVPVDYEYNSFSLTNSADEVILVCATTEIDRVNYDDGTTFPDPNGASMNLDPASFDASSNDEGANWCEATSEITAGGDLGTPGADNDACSVTPTCSITALFTSNEACNGSDFEFDVNFTPTNGSGVYEVIEVGGSTLATSTVSPIQINIANSSMTGTIDIQVRDANDAACSSTIVQVTVQDCVTNTCPVTLSRSGTETTGIFQASQLVETSGATFVGSGEDVTYDAGNEVDLHPEFTVELGGVFLATIGGCTPLMGGDQPSKMMKETKDGLFLSTEKLNSVITLLYLDASGQIIGSKTLLNNQAEIFIPVEQIPSGTMQYRMTFKSE